MSRGTMVLETETAPGEGTSVQVFHCPNDVAVPTAPPRAAKNALTFIAVSQFESAFTRQWEDNVTVLEDRF